MITTAYRMMAFFKPLARAPRGAHGLRFVGATRAPSDRPLWRGELPMHFVVPPLARRANPVHPVDINHRAHRGAQDD